MAGGNCVNLLNIFGDKGLVGSVVDILKGTGLLKDPEAELKATQALMNYELQTQQQLSSQIESINATMREEAKSEHWPQYSWRPSIGFAFAIQALSLGLTFAFLIIRIALGYGLDGAAMNQISVVMGAMAPLFLAEGGILGVAAGLRGMEKWQKSK